MSQAGHVFVITGPSGVGKGTLISALMERMPELRLSVSATTRPPRPGEQDGEQYHFMSPAEFGEHVRSGDFVEHVTYAGFSYGTLRGELDRRVTAGVPVLLEIEVEGARLVRTALPHATLIFIAPPAVAELRARLLGRGTDDPAKIERRLLVAEEELRAAPEFGHVVHNDELPRALAQLEAIVRDTLDATEAVRAPAGA
ncbi:MAG: guanylate kinase [Acidobacteriota bacterium]|nr:guanylate kinase [Acidobacteriota bacterium]